jgi:hypothetical protein
MLYSSLTCRLKTQHLALSEIIKNSDEQTLLFRPEPGKWNIHDNIAHLAIYQPKFIERINRILKEDGPEFAPYRADDDPDFIAGQKLSNRRRIIWLLSGLNDAQLARTGTHLKYGKLTIVDWTEFFLLHEAHHLFTIFRLAKG